MYAQYIQGYPLHDIRPLLHGLSTLASGSSSGPVPISPVLQGCLEAVLLTTLQPGKTRPLTPPKLILPHILFTDACDTGLGAVLVSSARRRTLSAPIVDPVVRAEHICSKEMLAVLWSLRQLKHLRRGQLRLFIDNQAVVAAINSRYSLSSRMSKYLTPLLQLAETRNLHLTATYVATDLNPADEPSRLYASTV